MTDRPPALSRHTMGKSGMAHRYAVGQSVHFTPRLRESGSAGTYQVIRLIPIENGAQLRYHIRSLGESRERVVDESQLSHAT